MAQAQRVQTKTPVDMLADLIGRYPELFYVAAVLRGADSDPFPSDLTFVFSARLRTIAGIPTPWAGAIRLPGVCLSEITRMVLNMDKSAEHFLDYVVKAAHYMVRWRPDAAEELLELRDLAAALREVAASFEWRSEWIAWPEWFIEGMDRLVNWLNRARFLRIRC